MRTTGNPALSPAVKYTSDGVTHSEFGNDPDVAVGAPVSVFPEPASLGLVGFGVLAALRRRK